MAYIQTEQLKLQTILSQQTAFTHFEKLSDEGEIATFNTLPDEK